MDARTSGAPQAPARLGLFLFLVSVTAMFAAALVAYLVTRSAQVGQFADRGVPAGIWASTAILGAFGATMHWAKRAARQNAPERCHRALQLALLLAAAFCAAQVLNWRSVYRVEEVRTTMYAFTFYLLTGLHLVHVVGGFLPLAVITYRAGKREYSSSRLEPLRLITAYWDFLSVVWLVLLAVLLWGS